MELEERIFRVLAVSSGAKFSDSLNGVLSERRNLEHETLSSASAARRRLSENGYDIVIINGPLSDENGMRFAVECASENRRAVLLIVPNEYYDEIFSRVSGQGVYLLPKPLSAYLLRQALDWLETVCIQLSSFEKRSETLENRMNEIKLINRAKLLLISVYGLSEEQAHRRIEKSAMDRGVKKSIIAEEIIAMNDTG